MQDPLVDDAGIRSKVSWHPCCGGHEAQPGEDVLFSSLSIRCLVRMFYFFRFRHPLSCYIIQVNHRCTVKIGVNREYAGDMHGDMHRGSL